MKENQDKNNIFTLISVVLVGFAFFSFATAWYMNLKTPILEQTINDQTMELGPIMVKKPHTVMAVKLKQQLRRNGSWNYITCEVLNEKKDHVFGFGDEFSFETGRDSDGTWVERKDRVGTKITFSKAGKYFLRFRTESKNKITVPIEVMVSQYNGSSLPHTLLGIFLLICAIAVNEHNNSTIRKAYAQMEKRGGN